MVHDDFLLRDCIAPRKSCRSQLSTAQEILLETKVQLLHDGWAPEMVYTVSRLKTSMGIAQQYPNHCFSERSYRSPSSSAAQNNVPRSKVPMVPQRLISGNVAHCRLADSHLQPCSVRQAV